MNKRSTGKDYGVIFTLSPYTSNIDASVDYSTDGFLAVFRHFTSLRGYSDSRPQLVGTLNELKKAVASWN